MKLISDKDEGKFFSLLLPMFQIENFENSLGELLNSFLLDIRRSAVFMVNNEQISPTAAVFPLFTFE